MVKKTIVVTGGAGFIGSNLCIYLLSQSPDNYVICVDNLITGSLDNLREIYEDGGGVSMRARFSFIDYDITKPVCPALFGEHVDEIYHLASIASPEKYKKYSMPTLLTSINGTQRVLDYCVLYNCKMLFTSTSEVYGDPLIHPQPESYYGNVNTVGERSCYDEGKRVAETLIYEYQKSFPELELKVARLFNTYGPRMHPNDGRVVSNFIVQALNNKPITIYGDGSQTRSFCYVDDLITGMIKLMESHKSITGPINMGNPSEFTMIELAELVIKLTSSRSKLKFKPLPEDDPKQRQPNISLAKSKLNWSPKVSLEEGLNKTITYFKNLLDK